MTNFAEEKVMYMKLTYRPRGTCSVQMDVEVQDGIVTNVEVLGGCSGNLQGISRLVVGMPAREVVEKLRGIRCGMKPTSCPDQLSKALERCLEQEKKAAGK